MLFFPVISLLQFSRTIDFPNDGQRIAKVKFLLENGFSDRVVISHDIHTKHRLVRTRETLPYHPTTTYKIQRE